MIKQKKMKQSSEFIFKRLFHLFLLLLEASYKQGIFAHPSSLNKSILQF